MPDQVELLQHAQQVNANINPEEASGIPNREVGRVGTIGSQPGNPNVAQTRRIGDSNGDASLVFVNEDDEPKNPNNERVARRLEAEKARLADAMREREPVSVHRAGEAKDDLSSGGLGGVFGSARADLGDGGVDAAQHAAADARQEAASKAAEAAKPGDGWGASVPTGAKQARSNSLLGDDTPPSA